MGLFTRGDSNGPAEKECLEPGGVLGEQEGLQRVEEAEIEASVDEDTAAGDTETPVEAEPAVFPGKEDGDGIKTTILRKTRRGSLIVLT